MKKPTARNAFADAARARNMAQFARAFVDEFEGDAGRFAARWIGFNSLYDVWSGQSERERFTHAIKHGLTDEQAHHILECCAADMTYLASLPPGNMRHERTAGRFREQARRDMAAALDGRLRPTDRLASLVAVVYQVRCNLFHGAKNPKLVRSRRLLVIGAHITELVLNRLAENAETAAEVIV